MTSANDFFVRMVINLPVNSVVEISGDTTDSLGRGLQTHEGVGGDSMSTGSARLSDVPPVIGNVPVLHSIRQLSNKTSHVPTMAWVVNSSATGWI